MALAIDREAAPLAEPAPGLFELGAASEFEPGRFRVFDLGGRSVGVIRRPDGSFRALLNRCPHMAAPVCRGRVQGMFAPARPDELVWVDEGEILMCPWHGWEYRIDDGAAASNITRTRLRTYAVEVDERGTVRVDTKAHGTRPPRKPPNRTPNQNPNQNPNKEQKQ